MKKILGTKEWAGKNFNVFNGCSNNCKYCYAQEMANRFGRKELDTWQEEELNKKGIDQPINYVPGLVMYPSTHDISPENLRFSLSFLERLINAGNKVLIVSKPHLECIEAITEEFKMCKKNILFRFTIGSSDNETLAFWEPDAPSFKERLKCLKLAFKEGFETSISCEPMLDDEVEDVITAVSPYVTETIWLGKMNKAKQRLTMNGHGDPVTLRKASEMLSRQSDHYIFSLYKKYKDNPKIRWKDSIKEILGKNGIIV